MVETMRRKRNKLNVNKTNEKEKAFVLDRQIKNRRKYTHKKKSLDRTK